MVTTTRNRSRAAATHPLPMIAKACTQEEGEEKVVDTKHGKGGKYGLAAGCSPHLAARFEVVVYSDTREHVVNEGSQKEGPAAREGESGWCGDTKQVCSLPSSSKWLCDLTACPHHSKHREEPATKMRVTISSSPSY